MKSLTRGHFKAGLDSLHGSKWRNFWTMLGIIIGVASVITVVGIGEGIKQQIGNEIHQFGKDLIVVQPEQLHAGTGFQANNVSFLSGLSITGSLSGQDYSAVS